MEQILRGQSGQSLVQVMMVAAVGVIIALGIATVMTNMQLSANSVKYRSDGDNFNEEMRALLSSPVACTNTFGGLVVGPATTFNIASIFDGSPAPGVLTYSAGNTYGDQSIFLSSMVLANYQVGGAPNTAMMTLTNNLTTKKRALGAQNLVRTINISLQVDNTNKITSCIALAKMSDGIWQRSQANANNIFFTGPPAPATGGSVGIGTGTPAATLNIVTANPAGYSELRVQQTANPNRLAGLFTEQGGGDSGLVVSNNLANNLQTWEIAIGPGGGAGQPDDFSIAHPGSAGVFAIAPNGNVGVGTTAPGTILHMFTPTQTELRLDSGSSAAGNLGMLSFALNGVDQWQIFHYQDNGLWIQNLPGHGQHIINATSMTVAWNTNSWAAQSDVRLKTNIETLPVLDRLDGYRAVSFNWKKSGLHDIGVIAQEVYKIFPEVVNKGSDNDEALKDEKSAWSVMYDRLGALALQAVRELFDLWRIDHDQIAALKADNIRLQNSNRQLTEWICEKDPKAALCGQ